MTANQETKGRDFSSAAARRASASSPRASTHSAPPLFTHEVATKSRTHASATCNRTIERPYCQSLPRGHQLSCACAVYPRPASLTSFRGTAEPRAERSPRARATTDGAPRWCRGGAPPGRASPPPQGTVSPQDAPPPPQDASPPQDRPLPQQRRAESAAAAVGAPPSGSPPPSCRRTSEPFSHIRARRRSRAAGVSLAAHGARGLSVPPPLRSTTPSRNSPSASSLGAAARA